MNITILIGRLTKDPVISVTNTGKKVAKFSLAVDDGKDKEGKRLSQYFNLVAWQQSADLIENYVKKGHRLSVTGKLMNRTWDKPDGTKGYMTEIIVNSLEMLTSKIEAQSLDTPEGQTAVRKSEYETKNGKAKAQVPDEELPEIDVDSININMPF